MHHLARIISLTALVVVPPLTAGAQTASTRTATDTPQATAGSSTPKATRSEGVQGAQTQRVEDNKSDNHSAHSGTTGATAKTTAAGSASGSKTGSAARQ